MDDTAEGTVLKHFAAMQEAGACPELLGLASAKGVRFVATCYNNSNGHIEERAEVPEAAIEALYTRFLREIQ